MKYMNLATIKLLFQLGVKNSCVSANMLKINWSVGRRNFFFFSIFFFPEKTRVWPVIFIKTQVFC